MTHLDSVAFRKARKDDLSAIIALLADDELGMQREDTRLPVADEYQTAFAAIEADPNQLLVVAANDKQIVGTFQLSFIPLAWDAK